MAASTTITSRAAASFPVYQGIGAGALQAAYGTHAFVANDDEVGDIFQMCKIPAGAVVLGGWVQADDLDTGAETLDFDLGWAANGAEAADPDGLGNFGVQTGDALANIKPEVGIFLPLGGTLFTVGPQTFTRETTIELKIIAAAATLAAGPLTVVVFYLVP